MNLLNYYEQHDGFCANMLLVHGYTSKDKKKIKIIIYVKFISSKA